MLKFRAFVVHTSLIAICLFALLACDAREGPDEVSRQEGAATSSIKEPIEVTTLSTASPSATSEATATPEAPEGTATPTPSPTPIANSFLEGFDREPESPEAWQPENWDVTIHSRDRETWQELEMMQAAHGSNCEPPPANHTISAYEDAVYICRNHLMTAIMAAGYGVIYLTPDQLVDFSEQEAVIRFDLSTKRTSPRDWVDLWITPYEDNLQLPLDGGLPDLSDEPRRSVHIRLDYGTQGKKVSGNKFLVRISDNFQVKELPLNDVRGYDAVLTPDAKRRDTFELRISASHIKFGMPEHDLWWVDTDISLNWATGVVQFGHHSYNPVKVCPACAPNTWHWDNLFISPAKPFSILRADQRFVDEENGPVVNFPTPAPQHAHLRFAGIGNELELSFDGGQNWQPAQLQAHAQNNLADEHFKSYWTPIPAGTSQVHIRGKKWWGAGWHVRDISIWSPEAEE
ncbi:MAG: hypothetical protein ACPGWR_13265 [Ardenticatenaceae bacterium]